MCGRGMHRRRSRSELPVAGSIVRGRADKMHDITHSFRRSVLLGSRNQILVTLQGIKKWRAGLDEYKGDFATVA